MVKKMELQEIIERQLREQSQMEERLAALSAHVKHLEEDLDTARKDLLKSKDVNRKLERDGISWSSLGGLKGVKPPEAFGEWSRDWSLGWRCCSNKNSNFHIYTQWFQTLKQREKEHLMCWL